ncbi:MAG TPA: cell surface protein SprA, partial [Gemmatimonadales bacterium]|nr:cell surface protein SprA [Gemmatimonadales bacterium]
PSRTGVNPNLGGINAVAIGADTTQRVTALWELLTYGVDYYIDGSRLWLALSARLDQNDYLAVSYQSGAGPVGTYPSANTPVPAGSPPADTLRLIVQPRVDASKGTFRHEMRHIYRVAGADLEPSSLLVNLSLNRSERPLLPGALGTYLAQLGLATTQDPTVFNRQDRLFPRTRDPGAMDILKESFIVFPTTQPFADNVKLTAAERNDSLYRTPDYLLYSEGPAAKFIFRLRYNASSTGDRSTLDLGALQIRDDSETLYYNGRKLDRGVDYSINYDLGRVTFLNPSELFGNGSGTIQARFEERGVFAVAPTQIYGLATRYSLGETGGINLMGLYQVEQSAFNRPQLGLEASAHMIGGISTDLRFRPSAITRLVNSLTSAPATAPSTLTLNAELALTKPDPNRSGQAYLEEFEGDPGIELSLRETVWSFGSRPQSTLGVDQIVGQVFDTADAAQLTWQNLIINDAGQVVELRARDIDDRIRVAGQQDNLETVLYAALQADTVGSFEGGLVRWKMPARPGAPRWRTMVTPLSSTGVDLSKNEFLEFWVFHPANHSVENAGVSLVFDLGTVSEDAIAIAPESLTVVGSDSSFSGRQFVGLGRLDTERQPTGIFNAETDDIGILNDRPDILISNGVPQQSVDLCRRQLSNAVQVYRWG